MNQQANTPTTYLRKPGVKMKAEEARGVSLKCRARDKALMYDARDLIEAYPSEIRKLFELLTKKDGKSLKDKIKDISAFLSGKYSSKEAEKLNQRIADLEQEIIELKLKMPVTTGKEKPANPYIYTGQPKQVLPQSYYP